ncbi:adenine phosphoribosyltransferase [Propionibacterium australiense]|uniref:Adenine phosphoribosyltransferase n=1 Tax=Propionibacterium australiense TaxID=119981 RepID=A0A383S3T0_9ACTN|nr:adenine phosphoribosyltransferase [Propionibacterium australiense]RLP11506.1 adenine phosphoribosyltransferase [Propionibacterium australiense]RLP12758.1 adenine phosphoribosyltransferase [Propionibacterium australiense]SYZ32212.1 adenine phosphoribosyltransferase [Propionibacterium australiense]VEH90665.1 Adenine phosphoribosyltransferase [Propionibacterium australiense]
MAVNQARLERIESLIRTIPDFPKPGVIFRDITPLMADPDGLAETIDELINQIPGPVDVVAGVDSRGFLFGSPIAVKLGIGFVPIRKPGKLPAAVYEESFELEYGSSTLSIHQDALEPGQRVLLIDDLLATGGTLGAAARLVLRERAVLTHTETVLELSGLGGREHLARQGVDSFSSLLIF